MADFDIDGARKAGYSDGEIADFLGKEKGFDVQGAVKAGYAPAEIVAHLSALAPPAGGGRGSVNPPAVRPDGADTTASDDAMRAGDPMAMVAPEQVKAPERTGSVFDNQDAGGPRMDAPTNDASVNERALDNARKSNPAIDKSPMYSTGLANEKARALVDKGAVAQDKAEAVRTKSSGSTVQDVALNLLGGLGATVNKAGATVSQAIGAEDAEAAFDSAAETYKKMQADNGGGMIPGKVAGFVGAVAPAALVAAVLPATEAFTLVTNAGLFALPAFRDTLKEKLEQGQDFPLALAHASQSFGLNLFLPTFASKGGALVNSAAGKGVIGSAASAAAEGAGFSAATTALDKGTDLVAGEKNQKDWLDFADMGTMALGFGAMRGIHAGVGVAQAAGSAVMDRVGSPSQQFGRAFGQDVDAAGFNPVVVPGSLNPNLRDVAPKAADPVADIFKTGAVQDAAAAAERAAGLTPADGDLTPGDKIRRARPPRPTAEDAQETAQNIPENIPGALDERGDAAVSGVPASADGRGDHLGDGSVDDGLGTGGAGERAGVDAGSGERAAEAGDERLGAAGGDAAAVDLPAAEHRVEPFATKPEANMAGLKEGATAVPVEGGFALQLTTRPYSERERLDAAPDLSRLNRGLQVDSVARSETGLEDHAPAELLKTAPTPQMVVGRRIARLLGVKVVFVEDHVGFDGVSLNGVAYVSPQLKHPELAITGHEVLHSVMQQLRENDPARAQALHEQIAAYLRPEAVDKKQAAESDRSRRHAEEEVIADLNGSMWLDPKFWAEMRRNDPSTFRKVAYAFMQAVAHASKGLTRFKAESFANDVSAVRTILAREMAALAREEGVESHSPTEKQEMGVKPAADEAAARGQEPMFSADEPPAGARPKKPVDPRVAELKAILGEFEQKGDLTAVEAAKYRATVRELNGLNYETAKARSVKLVPPGERMSTLGDAVYEAAWKDMHAAKDTYLELKDHVAGAGFDADTAIDTILRGKNPDISARRLYDSFADTRAALRAQFGDTVPMYRAVGQQKAKLVENWASTREFASQFGGRIVERRIPVDNVISMVVSRNGMYHEFHVGEPPSRPDFSSKEPERKPGTVTREQARQMGDLRKKAQTLQELQAQGGDVYKAQLSRADRAAILESVRQLRAEGVPAGEARKQAVERLLEDTHAAIEKMQPGKPAFSRKEDKPFYSALARGIEGINAKSQPAEGWRAQIQGLVNKGSVKADEVEWSGLGDWLKLKSGKVSKQEVQDFIAANGVQVHEVTKESAPSMESVRDRYIKAMVREGATPSAADQMFREMQGFAENRDHDEALKDRGFDLVMKDGSLTGNEIHDAASNYDGGDTKYGQYVLPGGENYRELLLTLPEAGERVNKEYDEARRDHADALSEWKRASELYGKPDHPEVASAREHMMAQTKRLDAVKKRIDDLPLPYKSSHWDESNVIAHIRLNDRTDSEGKRVLFVEEAQSDFGQDARKRGFIGHYKPEDVKPLAEGDPESHDPEHFWQFRTPDNVFRIAKSKFSSEAAAHDYIVREKVTNSGGVPRAPFVDSTDKWLPLALKRIIKLAADEGYQRVAFVNGEQSADRYDLSKQISRVTYSDARVVRAYDHSGKNVINKRLESDEELPDVVGKEVAQRLIEAPKKDVRIDGVDFKARELSGLDLKVGGDGMKAFYNAVVPQALSKLLPKFGGGKMEEVTLPSHDKSTGRKHLFEELKQPGFSVTDAMREKTAGGVPMFSRKDKPEEPAKPATPNPSHGFHTREIQVDGQWRPIEDSTGRLLARGDFRGQQNLYRWFKDSVVTDSRGRPLVVYHGTTGDVEGFDPTRLGQTTNADSAKVGFFFTNDPATASNYATAFTGRTEGELARAVDAAEKRAQRTGKQSDWDAHDKLLEQYESAALGDPDRDELKQRLNAAEKEAERTGEWAEFNRIADRLAKHQPVKDGANVVPTYLSIQNPHVRDFAGAPWEENAFVKELAVALANEKDGVILRNVKDDPADPERVSDVYVAFKPEQVKSALGNRGTYDDSPDIRFARKGTTAATANLPASAPLGTWERSKSVVSDLIDEGLTRSGVYKFTSPMSEGSVRAKAIAQNFANAERQAKAEWQRIQDVIAKDFPDKTVREKMWNAADQENEILSGRLAPGAAVGLASLTPRQRDVVEQLHAYGEELLQRAKDVGMFSGEGVPYWTPRMMVLLDANGDYVKPTEPGKKQTSGGDGRNVFTSSSNLKQRKYLTAADTEAAMQAKGGELVRDITTMPMAMARLERAVAGRELINQIKDLGKAAGLATVSSSMHDGFFTLDHPAFTTYQPRFEQDPATGKTVVQKDAHGDPILDRVPLYMSKEFEGPIKAILSNTDGTAYRAYMLLKSKAMSAIMFSPLIHQMVIFGRALGYDPTMVGTVGLYFRGNAAKRDEALVRTAIDAGLVPMGGSHAGMIDVTDIARGIGREGGLGDPNESWIAHGAKAIIGAVNKDAGAAAKRFVDKAGDIWHGTLLWDRVGDLQMGIFSHAYDRLQSEGFDPKVAAVMAAHWGNRYAGAVGRENMGEYARKAANVLLFSRSFNAGNLGTIKDMLYGLPAGLRAKIEYEHGKAAASQAFTEARRKAVGGFIADAALSLIALSLAQSAVDKLKKDKGWDEIFGGYMDRAKRMVEEVKRHPMTPKSYSPWQLSPTHDNEPGKQDRVDMGEIPGAGGRHEYMRLPTGKVVEDLINWTTHPAETFSSKMSPLAKAAWQIVSNDKGFGVPVYDPDGSMAGFGVDVAKHLAKAQTPWDTIVTAWDKFQGKTTPIENAKLLGNMTGFSASQGHPQGPEAGVAAQVEERVKAQKLMAMEEVKRLLRYDKEDQAREKLEAVGLTPREVNQVIKKIENPKEMTPAQRRRFNQHGTEEDQQRMERVTR